MLKITLNTTLPAAVNKVIADFDRKQAALLQEIGTTVLSRQRLSFEKKSRGGIGDDGVQWKPLAESTERRKAGKERDTKTKMNKVRKLKGQLKKAKGELRAATTKQKRDKLFDRIKTLETKISVESKPAKSQIGVDTGLMRNTVIPGYKAGDSKGDNIFEVQGATVTVGYGREYAPWFDEGTERQPARPLMPNAMPPTWATAIDRVVQDWVQDIVSELER